jgi:hypothetical protein
MSESKMQADCHKDRVDYGDGLCKECYDKFMYYRQIVCSNVPYQKFKDAEGHRRELVELVALESTLAARLIEIRARINILNTKIERGE